MADTIKTSLGPCVGVWAACRVFVRLLDLIMFELWFFCHRLASVHIHVLVCRVCVRNIYTIRPIEHATTLHMPQLSFCCPHEKNPRRFHIKWER